NVVGVGDGGKGGQAVRRGRPRGPRRFPPRRPPPLRHAQSIPPLPAGDNDNVPTFSAIGAGTRSAGGGLLRKLALLAVAMQLAPTLDSAARRQRWFLRGAASFRSH